MMIGLTRVQVQGAMLAALADAIAPIVTFPTVANNCFTASSTNSSSASAQTNAGTSRCPHFAGIAATELTLTYSNHYISGSSGAQSTDNPGPAAYTIGAAIEVDGTLFPVTFAGSARVTLQPGQVTTCDPVVGLALSPGQLFFTRTYISATTWRPNRVSVHASSEGGFVTTSDLTVAGSGSVADSISAMFVPALIGGKAASGASAAIIGDSIAGGSGEFSSTEGMASLGLTGQRGGFAMRAAFGRAGATTFARGGDRLAFWLTQSGHLYRHPLLRGFTHALANYGTNDIVTGAASLTDMQTNLLNFWQILAAMNIKVGHGTILPRTTSTDSWATVANQTPLASESVRVALNTWLRAGAPIAAGVKPIVAASSGSTVLAGQPGHPLAAVFDLAAAVESSLNSGKFRVDQGVPTIDGVHPNTALHILMAGQIPASFFD